MALTNAERQRRYRQRTAQELTRLNVPLNKQAADTLTRLVHRTGKTKRAVVEETLIAAGANEAHQARDNPLLCNGPELINAEHQRLFTIPKPLFSNESSLKVPTLPEQQTITGDVEVDACLWLANVCKTARDFHVLDLVLEAAQRITTPSEEIERRYVSWLRGQPNIHPLQMAFASIGMGNIQEKVEAARERIAKYNEAAVIFGSYQQALMPTPAEQMVERTAGALPDVHAWNCTQAEYAKLFTDSVNPSTLTEVAAELRYWNWLYQARWRMQQTEAPDEYLPDDPPIIEARRQWVEGLLCELPPQDHQEVLDIIKAVRSELVDTGSIDDSKKHADIFEHLLNCVVTEAVGPRDGYIEEVGA